ncbi:MAG: hypothetical protein JWO89_1915 [Verrucomicrobiaceae bacterium]|nr:hypothetical protein [Verrucomicrobiaceae bacterium]MDB6118300.1 hypothetical protein [Verrucomicrobiaceae bacterium]
MSTTLASPDLTQSPPRSARCRLGGYVLLPRLLDKCRAELAGKNGEYHYNCPMDRHFFNFTGVDHEALKTEAATGKGDGELLEWINANAKTQRGAWEVLQWSDYHLNRGPDSDSETVAFFHGLINNHTKTREDITTWADALDLDDYCSFGGKA